MVLSERGYLFQEFLLTPAQVEVVLIFYLRSFFCFYPFFLLFFFQIFFFALFIFEQFAFLLQDLLNFVYIRTKTYLYYDVINPATMASIDPLL